MAVGKIKIVSDVWYAKRNTPYAIIHGEKGIVVRDKYILTASQVPTYTEFKKIKPTPIIDTKQNGNIG